MKLMLLISLLSFFLSTSSSASHCPSPDRVPIEIKRFAMTQVSEFCPKTFHSEVLEVMSMKYSSTDLSQTFDLRVEGEEADLRIIIERLDCRRPMEMDLLYYDFSVGCY